MPPLFFIGHPVGSSHHRVECSDGYVHGEHRNGALESAFDVVDCLERWNGALVFVSSLFGFSQRTSIKKHLLHRLPLLLHVQREHQLDVRGACILLDCANLRVVGEDGSTGCHCVDLLLLSDLLLKPRDELVSRD